VTKDQGIGIAKRKAHSEEHIAHGEWRMAEGVEAGALIRAFPEPPGKVHLLYGSDGVFPLSLTMAAHAIRREVPIAVVDGCNRFDVHLLSRFAREHRLDANAFLRRIFISRGFTCYQMEQAIAYRLPAFLRRIGSNVAMVFGLLDTFYDEQAPLREVRQILGRVQESFAAMKADGVSLLIVCREQRVLPEERNQLFTRLKGGMDRVYRLEAEEVRLVLEGKESSRNGALSKDKNHAMTQRRKARNEKMIIIDGRGSIPSL